MNGACPNPIPWDILVDYWAGDLARVEGERIEEHLFGCGACTAEAARVAAVTEALREMIPPVLSRERLERLRATGVRMRENEFVPGERREVAFAADADLMIHRLGGLDLSGADRVTCRIVAESTGAPMAALGEVPFERDEGAVLIACQRHFAAFPHDTRFELSIHRPGQPVENAAYTVLHLYD
jgi:anti-sigma factor RsiW